MQTSTSSLTRVCRLHRQYTNTSDNPISTSTPQDKFQGQRELQRLTQRWGIQTQGQHERNPSPERLQTQYRDYMQILQLMAPQDRRRMQGLRGQSVHSLGSCVLHLHIDKKAFPTIFEVTNMTGPVILGRTQATAMGYIQFPQIWQPHTLTAFPNASRKLCTHRTPTPKTILYSQAHISKRTQP